MSERGMGAAVGQVPEMCELNTRWASEATTIPVIVKLTPNVTDIRTSAHAALAGGADALSLINTINSITKVDLDTLRVVPDIGGRATHGGYAGPAVKPIALHMLAELMTDAEIRGVGMPISGIGGIVTWQDAAEYLLLGASSVQVCTAAMHYGFRIIEDLVDGLSNWMDGKGFSAIEDFRGRALAGVGSFGQLNIVPRRRPRRARQVRQMQPLLRCLPGQRTPVHRPSGPQRQRGPTRPRPRRQRQARLGRPADTCHPRGRLRRVCPVRDVCPVDGCITMVPVDSGRPPVTWDRVPPSRGNH